jgi:hypothetical protein
MEDQDTKAKPENKTDGMLPENEKDKEPEDNSFFEAIWEKENPD